MIITPRIMSTKPRRSLRRWLRNMAATITLYSRPTTNPCRCRGPVLSNLTTSSWSQSSVHIPTTYHPGTKTWSLDVDEAAQDPVSGSNLAYTIHFYASTHKQSLRNKCISAKSSGAALFATEWGTCRADGDGTLDLAETDVWLGFLAYHGISYANWAVSDKQEACSALAPGASTSGGWSDGQLTDSGRYMRGAIINGHDGAEPGPTLGCCMFGADCGDCGEDGTGWCHESASNCEQCTGSFDASAEAPNCAR